MSGLFGKTPWLMATRATALFALLLAACDDDEGGPLPADGSAIVDGPLADGVDAADGGAGGDGSVGDSATDLGATTTYSLTILHTNDLHSHLQGHGPEKDYTPATPNDDTTVGGFARLATAVGTYRAMAAAAGREVLLLDGGDFMMGTLFQLAGTTLAAELQLMQAVGYDAVAVGNHEYDWTPAGLAAILQAAVAKNVSLPVLASNVRFSPVSTEDDGLEMLLDPGPLKRKFIKTLPSGLKVGFFGLLGSQAQSFAPAARPLTFEAINTTATAMVNELRNVDKVDLVIALSHSGISSTGQGEDRELARAVPGIDIIISGHTHETLAQPVVQGKTIIVTAGSYGEFLGRLGVDVQKQGGVTTAVTVTSYNLLPIDDKIPGAPQAQAAIDQVIAGIDMNLAPGGLSYAKPVVQTAFDLDPGTFVESGLGDLITDAYLAGARRFDPDPANDPTQFAIEVNGQIRAPILKGTTGTVWFADLFRVIPLGIGPDRRPGAPIVTYYLTGKDIRSGLELSAAAPVLGDDVYTMQMSGLEVTIDAKKPAFQRVVGLRITSGASAVIDPTDDTKCYKVATTLYLAGLFDLVGAVTQNQLTVKGKQKDCVTPVDIFQQLVDTSPTMPGVQELKPYTALLGFVSALPDANMDGVPDMPASYAMPAGRVKILP
jgi:5'-nucleotidase/UDP-sugar diphosphatase